MRVFESMFSWIRAEENVVMTIDDVLERAQDAVYRYGIRGLVIDPYNEMEHNRPKQMSETEYVSQLLSKVRRRSCHTLACTSRLSDST
jgi:twinkle protein